MEQIASHLPLSLYVHLPWCTRRCPYCDFNAHVQKQKDYARYVDALLADLRQQLPEIQGRQIESVFFGGGTPSLFPAEHLQRFFEQLRELLPLQPDAEITLEANPGTVEQQRFIDFRQLGINRLSLGIQSFDSRLLSLIGRIHDATEAATAIDIAQQAGFERINLDLMYGLPEQSLEQALEDVNRALAFATEHVSYYQLTLEPNTHFHKYPPSLPAEETIEQMQKLAMQHFAAAGLEQYEISAFSRRGKQCWHNLNYWMHGDYLALGAGAHGKLTALPGYRIHRYQNYRQPQQYMDNALHGQARAARHLVQPDEQIFEFMLNNLRLNQGFTPKLFTQRCGIDFAQIAPKLSQLMAEGWLENIDGHWRRTQQGTDFLNNLVAMFLPK